MRERPLNGPTMPASRLGKSSRARRGGDLQALEDTIIGALRRPLRQSRPRWARYLLPIACVALAAALEFLVGEALGSMPMVLYIPAVLFAAWFGGLGPGLLATALSLIAPDVLRTVSALADQQAGLDTLQRLVFALVGMITSWLYESVYRQRRQLETAVAEAQESERRFRLTADYAPMMVWMTGHDMEYDWFNRRWLEYRGHSLDEELSGDWREAVHPDDRERCIAVRREAAEARQPFTLEYRLGRHDGQQRWMLDQGVPRRGRDGVFTGYIGCCLDVESMKQAQEDNQLLLAAAEQAREEADAASRAKDVFLATVSHELRNPLNAIVGWAHVLRNDGVTPDDVQRGAEVIAQSAQAQVRLIEELLDVSRVITGTMRLNRRPSDLREIVLAAVHAHQPAASAKRLALEVDAAPVPVTFGDPDRLRQVVTNLVSNAVTYTPRGGRARVELRAEGQELLLRVSDNGVGIDPDFLPHVFEAFRQSSDRRSHSGLGLGLSVVRHLVQMHGGRVAAASEGRGCGAEFIVRLPVTPAPSDFEEEVDSGPYPALPDPLRGKRVLVVDDDTAALQLLEKWLSGRDAVVLTAGSAREALKLAPRFRPEIVLSDIQMPGGDGYELIRELRKLPASEGGTAAVAALTAFAGETEHRSLLAAGFQVHLTKPIEPDTLLHELARLVRH